MASVTKTWTFTGSAEGFTEVGINAQITFEYAPFYTNTVAFRNPVAFVAGTEKARNSLTTWESWGVPAGATVDSIKVSYTTVENNGGGFVYTRVLDSSNALVTSVSDITGVTDRAVSASYQASNTQVKMEFEGTGGTWNDGEGDLGGTITFDDVVLTINYTTGGGTTFTPTVRMF